MNESFIELRLEHEGPFRKARGLQERETKYCLVESDILIVGMQVFGGGDIRTFIYTLA